jgi:hypothetical protein
VPERAKFGVVSAVVAIERAEWHAASASDIPIATFV